VHAADLYTETRGRVVATVAELDPSLPVPACPGWSAREVVAHLVGLASDVVTGRVAGYAGQEWTEAQVRDRADRSMGELIAEWEELMPAFLGINRDLAGSSLPEMIEHVIGPLPKTSFEAAFHVDLLHHEHDLLGAVGTPREEHLPADLAAMRAQLTNVRLQFAMAGLPTLRLVGVDAGRTWDVGRGEPVASVAGTVIDFLRAFGGRRTLDQIRELDWRGDVEGMAEALVLPFFEAPSQPIPGG